MKDTHRFVTAVLDTGNTSKCFTYYNCSVDFVLNICRKYEGKIYSIETPLGVWYPAGNSPNSLLDRREQA